MTGSLLQVTVDRLNEVTSDLMDAYTALGELQKAEHEQRTNSWFMSEWEDKPSDRTRDKKAALDTLDVTSDIFETRAAVEALTADRTRLLAVIEVELTTARLNARSST